jgi:hypothetical protein
MGLVVICDQRSLDGFGGGPVVPECVLNAEGSLM